MCLPCFTVLRETARRGPFQVARTHAVGAPRAGVGSLRTITYYNVLYYDMISYYTIASTITITITSANKLTVASGPLLPALPGPRRAPGGRRRGQRHRHRAGARAG